MCYIVVKKRDSLGCCAYRTKHGKELVALKNKIPVKSGLQVFTISNPSAYNEYAPYVFAHSEAELLKMADEM